MIINAGRSVELSGFNPILSSPSQVAVGAYNSGNSSDLKITSPEIRLYNGGLIASYTFSSGDAGNVTINAPNSIDITIPVGDLSYNIPSGISSYAVPPPAPIQQALGLSSKLSGASGNIRIKTGQLSLFKSSITVGNLGTGTAGSVDIDANIVSLQNNSYIDAGTALGNGGNISLHANYVQLLGGSTISANIINPLATVRLLDIDTPYTFPFSGIGDGGNININTIFLTGSGSSSITANAFEGRGGNIRINTRGLFFSSDSFITASSQLGVNGTVDIKFNNQDPTRGITTVPKIAQESPKMASGCAAQSSTGRDILVVRGKDSPPPDSDEHIDSQPIWQRDFVSVEFTDPTAKLQSSAIKETTKIVEAQGWVIDEEGNVELVATIPNQVSHNNFLAASSCSSVSSVAEVFPSFKAK